MNARVTNQDIHENKSRLNERHYVLASAYPTSLDRFQVGPARGEINDRLRRFGDRFAFITYKSKDTGDAFFAIPFSRIRAEFTNDRITRNDTASWNASIRGGWFHTSETQDRRVNVADCHGSTALAQRIVRASLLRTGGIADMEMALNELCGANPNG